MAYQAGQADKFYHHYVYDLNQRLTEVYTSLDGTNKTLHAKYIYYLHGPLKRVELASKRFWIKRNQSKFNKDFDDIC